MYLANAFSLNMLDFSPATCGQAVLRVRETSLDEARKLAAGCKSAVGHPDTAAIFASQLGCPVEVARVTIQLSYGSSVLVGQYRGPRLAEGTKTLPDGATIQWLVVEVI